MSTSWKRVIGLTGALVCFALMAMPQALADNLYGLHYNSRNLYSVSETDASVSLIGNTGVALGGMDMSSDGFLYGITTGSSASLYRIDPSTADTTMIGPLGLGFVFEGALVISPEGVLYGTNGDAASSPQLFTIDINTGTATVVGIITGGNHDVNGLAWRSDGMLVGMDGNQNVLLKINPATAVSSVITLFTPNIGLAGGMAVYDGTGYFATGGSVVGGTNELYRFDLFTGAHTLIAGFPADEITGLGFSALAAVPEPTSVVLLALGGLAALNRRRR
ncbi:MAG: PEP-CTERM sorting domain-containing protein [Planctomycetota bacterium]